MVKKFQREAESHAQVFQKVPQNIERTGSSSRIRSRKRESLSQMMALHLFPASLHPISNPSSSSSSSRSKQRHLLLQLSPPRLRSDRSQSGVTENDSDPSSSGSSSSSVRTQLDLLEQLTSTSDGRTGMAPFLVVVMAPQALANLGTFLSFFSS
ncbi:hypothetical protein F2Q68_00028305 [Brassica cretica]|uniref:Uncharacterized protein n=1 Tax=Brassica cretica TaxID=69181 RepID=A0A8S9IA32_BRACR|nr:hypothetical protein F2Q68_00028305 [Brassica cretica]